jgi:hypothetical protein
MARTNFESEIKYEKREPSKEWNFDKVGAQNNINYLKSKSRLSPGCEIVTNGLYSLASGFQTLASVIYYYPTIAHLGVPPHLIVWDATDPASGPTPGVSFADEFHNRAEFHWEIARYGDKIYQYVKLLTSPPPNPTSEHFLLELNLDVLTPIANFNRMIQISNPQAGYYSALTSMGAIKVAGAHGRDIYSWDISGTLAQETYHFSTPSRFGIIGDMVYEPITGDFITILYESSASNNQAQVVRFSYTGSTIHSHLIPLGGQSAGAWCYDGEFHYAVTYDGNTSNPTTEIWKGTASGTLVATYYSSGSMIPPGGPITASIDAATDPACCTDPPILGCTDSSATNYDPTATHDCSGMQPFIDMSCCTYPCHQPI